MTDLRPGLELGGRFALLRQLGQGGLGEVWLAEDRAAGERVALKFIGSDQRALAGEFERAQAAAAGTSLVRGLFDFDGRSCIAMDYLPGGDFGQFRGRSYLVFLPALCEVARQLAAAHARDVVHRDLKCGNVLLDATQRPRLVDFGLAAPAGAVAGGGGSPYNQSPQQLRGAPAAPADDLYAFGALLYELLAGHPPFYPEVTRDKVLFEPPPALVPRQPAPERLRRLALRLLAKSPAERPESFAAVVTELDAAGAEAPDEPTHVVLPAPSDQPGAAARPRKSRVAPWALTVGAAALAVVAFLAWLPRASAPDEAAAERAARAAAAALAARLAAEQGAQEALQQATEARAEFERRYAALDRRAAAAWATAPFAAAQAAGAAAARAFDLGQPQDARRDWQAAVSGLVALEAEAPRAFAAAMRRGTEALGRYRLDEARAAFTLAAAIEPANAAPRRELERVTRFDRALALADAAARDERAGRAQAAQTKYREALALDPQAPGAREGLARLGAAQVGDAYAAAMAAGLEAQAAGRIAAARAEFQKAQQLRPGAAEPAAALQQLDQGQRSDAVTSLAARAAAAEGAEDWREALRLFTELAALEPTLAAAREGRARAVPRADLDRRLAAMVEKPDSVLSDAGRGDARRALAEADAIAAPGPRLNAQRAALAELLAAAERPVTVALESDGATEVVIYRVGRIGAFARREVELLPGRYTAVGTRAGFRDVRREFVVRPGHAGPAVEVRCEEQI